MSGEAIDTNAVTSHEQDGRVLSGVGVTADRLAETMERHAPEADKPGLGAGDAPGTGQGAPSSPDGQAKSDAPAQDEKPTRGRQRFADLTKERDEAKQRADAAEARAKELEAKIATPPPAAAAPEPAKPAATPADKPEKFTFPKWEDFAVANPTVSYDEWEIERFMAYDAWKDARTDIDGRIAQRLSAERAAHSADQVIAATHAKGREVYADFDAVLKTGPGAKVDLHADKGTAERRVTMIFTHPQSEHLQYAIMKDAALATKLAGLDDIAFGMEIARLVPTPSAPRREHVPPPAPFTPVNGNSATTQTASSELASKGFDFDRSGYREKRAAERKRAGR